MLLCHTIDFLFYELRQRRTTGRGQVLTANAVERERNTIVVRVLLATSVICLPRGPRYELVVYHRVGFCLHHAVYGVLSPLFSFVH